MKIQTKTKLRNATNKTQYWVEIDRAVLDNPDLSIAMVEKLLIAKNQASVAV